jgi:hypothetical protein
LPRIVSIPDPVLILTALTAALVLLSGVRAGTAQAPGAPMTWNQPDALDGWDLDGSGTWTASSGGLLMLEKPGTPAGPIRRPAALAILRTPPLDRVRLEVQLRCTAPPDVVYRDLQIVFGYESPARFYYAHLSGITDAVHNGVFLVNRADRRRIDSGATPPVLRDREWHRIRLDWAGETGRIQIFVDGSPAPAFDLTDATIRAGRVGVGSFDDTGEFRQMSVTGQGPLAGSLR